MTENPISPEEEARRRAERKANVQNASKPPIKVQPTIVSNEPGKPVNQIREPRVDFSSVNMQQGDDPTKWNYNRKPEDLK